MASPESSSSQTLWATASKEWVILPKPKPGRKPKKDFATSSEGDTSRRTQNRVAQRAFRERKQSQLAELQARIKSYEQGEIERNVALQKVAKRLKDENQLLRKENGALKARVADFEGRVEMNAQIMPNKTNDPSPTDKKRSRVPSPLHVSKRTRDEDCPRYNPLATDDMVPSFSSSPGCDSIDYFPPLPYVPPREMRSVSFSASDSVSPGCRDDEPDLLPSFVTCGFCEVGTLCVCREVACPAPMESVNSIKFNTTAKESNPPASDLPKTSSNRHQESMVPDKLPIYEPAVPIRRRNRGVLSNSIFPVHQTPPPAEATCSGDPGNCLACADDSFGQTFCTAIGSSSPSCDCSAEMMTGCCGSSSRCSGCPSTILSPEPPGQVEMMPTNDAWQRLKAHPNVQFADLTLLAEVVARKSKCSGPQLVVSSTTLSRSDKPHTNQGTNGGITGTHQGGESPPPRLVPHEVLLECGRRRMRQVRADGVHEALRLLDTEFS